MINYSLIITDYQPKLSIISLLTTDYKPTITDYKPAITDYKHNFS